MSIETAFFEKKPIVVVIDNNGGLASIGQQQERLFESGKTACVNVKAKPVLSPIVAAVASKREKSSIE